MKISAAAVNRREKALRKRARTRERDIRRDVDRVSVQFSNLLTSVVGLAGVLGVHKLFFRKRSTFAKHKQSLLARLLSAYDKKKALRRFLEFSIGYLVPLLTAFLRRVKRTKDALKESEGEVI